MRFILQVWVYAEDVYRFVMQSVWEKYQIIFSHAWTASAFKGAFGETLYVPNVKRHLENNLNWLQLMSNENSRFAGGFKGIAVTGWQRYNRYFYFVFYYYLHRFFSIVLLSVIGTITSPFYARSSRRPYRRWL